MTFEKKSNEYENERLELVLGKVKKQLEKCRESADVMKRDVIAIQKSMWDNVNPNPGDMTELADLWQFQTELVREGGKAVFAASRVARLEKMLDSPYFGRLDFQEEGMHEEEQIYIGISNLSDEKTGEYYIYDWRAPVCSMFYDYETGKAGYDCPAGRIEGLMGLKRQFRIWKGRLELMFDCSLAIDDEILQEILNRSADSRMKTIVTSIQREQNKVIRNDTHKLLVVHGPAGSGKTSIALHRAAYLLYRYKESIKAENIAIFSPNDVFSDYISEVLPELGEENIRRTTFQEYARNMLGESMRAEGTDEMMEYLLTAKESTEYAARTCSIAYKSSADFMELLERYSNLIEENRRFEDVCHNDVCIETGVEIDEYFRTGLRFLPVTKRLEKIRSRLINKLDPLIRARIEELMIIVADTGEFLDRAEIRGRSTFMAREEFKTVRETIERMAYLDTRDSYISLFNDVDLLKRLSVGRHPEGIEEVAALTIDKFAGKEIFNEDIAPYLFLTGLLSGITAMDDIKHVIIDEIQDYSVIQLELLHRLFRYSSMTLLGDPCQAVNPHSGNIDSRAIAEVFDTSSSAVINLTRSYRSTRQITRFCRKLLSLKDDGGYVDRDGDEPEIISRDTLEALYSKISEDIGKLSDSGFKSIAVICRTSADSRSVHEHMSKYMELRLVSGNDAEYVKGLCVIPSYLSKGLEFDAVLVLHLNKDDYKAEEERKLFYTVCTRALHRLNIYCLKQKTC